MLFLYKDFFYVRKGSGRNCCIEQEYKTVGNIRYYNFLKQIDNFIQQTYPSLNYQIINFEENIRKNTGNIKNYKINITGKVVDRKLNKSQVQSLKDYISLIIKKYYIFDN